MGDFRLFCISPSIQSILLSHPQVLKALSPGRVVTVYTHKYKYSLAVVLQLQGGGRGGSRSFTVLMLCNGGEEGEEFARSVVDVQLYKTVTPYEPVKVRHCVMSSPELICVSHSLE